MHSGFANSFGQRNWDSSENFNLDWSFFTPRQGVKAPMPGASHVELSTRTESLAARNILESASS